MIKKPSIGISSLILLSFVFMVYAVAANYSLANNAPHDATSTLTVACVNCHPARGTTSPWMSAPVVNDITQADNQCFQCHTAAKLGATSAGMVQTHSLFQASGINSWVMECKVCHNPHYQRQAMSYPAEGYLLQGVVSSTTISTVIVASSLTPSALKNYLVVPNTAYPDYIYRIKDNTINTIYIQTGAISGQYGIDPIYAAPGSTFGIKFGKMVKEAITTPNSGSKVVKFFNNQGPNSFATSSTTVDGVCQVCHTKTASYTNTGTLEGTGHPSFKTGTDCTICHQHTSGFKPNCGACHGNPPLISSSGGPDGMVGSEGGTGPTTPGAHQKHAVTLGYPCTTCHTGGMPDSTIYDKKIQIGFSIAGGTYQTGSYDGRSSLANGYTYTKGNPGTTVTTGGTKVCSNIYCHGATMAPNGGTDTTPIWDNPSTASCGSCHGASATVPPTRGSHYKHARNDLLGYAYPCGSCHKDPSVDTSQHVNNQSEVHFSSDPKTAGGSYNGTGTMLDAYGTCANVYCHSTVQSSPPGSAPIYRVTPTWGNNDTLGCGGCHDYAANLATGSHGKHMLHSDLQQCYQCHNYSNSNDSCMACHDANTIEPRRDKHANHEIDVAFAPQYGGTYSGTSAPGDAYGSCLSVYCHSPGTRNSEPYESPNVTPYWGVPFSTECKECHASNYDDMPTGSHQAHWVASGGVVYIPCQRCHNDTVSDYRTISTVSNHVNKVINIKFDSINSSGTYSFDGLSHGPGSITRTPGGATPGQCANLYCHSIVQTATGGPLTGAPGEYKDPPAWGSGSAVVCGDCHKSEANHNSFHGNSNPVMDSGSHSQHLAYKFFPTSYPKCIICHKYQPNDTSTTCFSSNCHGNSASHPDGVLNMAFDKTFGASAVYNGSTTPGDGGFGTCSNTYCHADGTSVWTGIITPNTTPEWGSGGIACDSCHQYPPNYPNGSPKANGHLSHSAYTCDKCHYMTTQNGSTISSYDTHVNKAYDVNSNSGAGVTFSYSGGICSSISCHQNTTNTVAWGISKPVLTSPTAPYTSVTSTTATLGATVKSDGFLAMTERGTVWGTSSNPTGNLLATSGTTTGTFSHARTGLPAGSKIYYRGYATNSAGTGYSSDGSFYTEPSTSASGVHFTAVGSTSMTVYWTRGNGDGVLVIIRQGLMVATAPTDGTYTYTADAVFGNGSAIGSAYAVYKGTGTSVTVTGISAGTSYYVAVYEYKGTVNTSGTDQGTNFISTPATGSQAIVGTPVLTSPTAPYTAVSISTATLGATVATDGGAGPITERGTVWNTTGAPTLADHTTTTTGTTGEFTTSVSGIPSGTKIYYRGYATNSLGTGYSPVGSFYTEPLTQASGVNFTSVGSTSMTVNWTRGSGDGVVVIMQVDSQYTPAPDDGYIYDDNYVYLIYKGTGTNVTLSGFLGGHTFCITVYEYKGTGDTSGVDQGINYKIPPATACQTVVGTPVLTSPTAPYTSVTSTKATLGATVTYDSGAAITERGTVWNVTGAPTIADHKTPMTGTTGLFTTSVSGITPGSRIYYRGYATNSQGTGYSPEGSFYTEPSTQASGVNFISVGQTSMTLKWTRGSGDGVIVLMRQESAVDQDPYDSVFTQYAVPNSTFGSGSAIGYGYVVYKGTGTSVTVTGLTAGTLYYMAVYEYAGTSDNYDFDHQGTDYKTPGATGSQATTMF